MSTTRSTRKTGPDTAPDPAPDAAPDTGTSAGAPRHPVSRRRLLGAAGAAGAAGLVAGGASGAVAAEALRDAPPAPLTSIGANGVPFHGPHQAGITTPLQAAGHFAAFDLAPGAGRKEAAALMRRWSAAARELSEGRAAAGATGSALDAGPAALTVTFGFGRTFFDRTGLAARRPAGLAPLPPFSADALDERRSDGDLWLQIGADDALVAFDALRTLQRRAGAAAVLRWQMSGFNRTPGATDRPRTARNLMGQVDGTNNPKPEDPDFDAHVFVAPDSGQAWLAGGSYAVFRRIRMLLDTWDHLSPERQERVIGRRKSDGAPLSGGGETTPVDMNKQLADGSLAIAGDAHVRVAAPESNGGATMLRRSFSYHDGYLDTRDGPVPDAGLLFVAWQADPLKGFVPVQRKLDRGDGLSRFLRHEASGLFAVPGGAAEGEYVGQRLLEG
ncbi:iron uptake transporter deferrochelatase/peroxidase subunit [Streptomyces sp. WMMC500]|uniref:iron uptake transporter deferrochelatase/peroxidase subunit n=1 Tax=Streptomyces sp. WMMC500 TaxID=3015154 RepID=UPI00248C1D9E|nr:iron uptake transporter deferrochelatase/peroxidase subunit [Streptomyces sp. WMMC500]WBB58008.1 iron uptake transporter deferrochelatase/peroxidase subunit [Streptomyces sp. WMMC500]